MPGHNQPLGRILAGERVVLTVSETKTTGAIAFGEICQNSIELETAIRDMKRQHPASRQLRCVKRDCLLRHQVNRNRVGVKRIQNDEAVMLVRRVL